MSARVFVADCGQTLVCDRFVRRRGRDRDREIDRNRDRNRDRDSNRERERERETWILAFESEGLCRCCGQTLVFDHVFCTAIAP